MGVFGLRNPLFPILQLHRCKNAHEENKTFLQVFPTIEELSLPDFVPVRI